MTQATLSSPKWPLSVEAKVPGIYTRIDDPEVFNWIQKTAFGKKRTGNSHKIFVTTGLHDSYEVGKRTKVIDMKDDNFVCDLPDYPIGVKYGVGGIVNGFPMVCGGVNVTDSTRDCFRLSQWIWQKSAVMNARRYDMGTGNVVFGNKLLISAKWRN